MYFSFDFVWYTIHIDIVRYEHIEGVGFFFLLNRQNQLSVTKVVCRQSLSSQKLLVLIFYEPSLRDKRTNNANTEI